jgi:hypothetical protein
LASAALSWWTIPSFNWTVELLAPILIKSDSIFILKWLLDGAATDEVDCGADDKKTCASWSILF